MRRRLWWAPPPATKRLAGGLRGSVLSRRPGSRPACRGAGRRDPEASPVPTRHPGPRPRTGLRSTWAWGSSIISTRRGDRARKLDRSVNPASRVRLPFRALGSWVSVSGPGGAARAGGFSSRPQAPAQPCLLQTPSPRLQGWRTRDVGERRASCCGGRWPWGLRGDGQAVSGGGLSVLTLRLGGSRRPAVTRRQAAAAGASLPGDEGVTGSAAAPGPAHSRARPSPGHPLWGGSHGQHLRWVMGPALWGLRRWWTP